MNTYNFILNLAGEHKKVADKINTILKIEKNNDILDVGGGSGLLAFHLSRFTNNVDILEPSKDMNLKNCFNFKIYQENINDFQIQNKFDFVLCFDSLHHFSNSYENKEEQITKGIKKMSKIAKKKVIIIEPNLDKFRTKYLRFIENVIFRQGSYFLRKEEFEDFLENYNYKIEIWRKYIIIEIDIKEKSI